MCLLAVLFTLCVVVAAGKRKKQTICAFLKAPTEIVKEKCPDTSFDTIDDVWPLQWHSFQVWKTSTLLPANPDLSFGVFMKTSGNAVWWLNQSSVELAPHLPWMYLRFGFNFLPRFFFYLACNVNANEVSGFN